MNFLINKANLLQFFFFGIIRGIISAQRNCEYSVSNSAINLIVYVLYNKKSKFVAIIN